jgi:hypothetical protein
MKTIEIKVVYRELRHPHRFNAKVTVPGRVLERRCPYDRHSERGLARQAIEVGRWRRLGGLW